MFSMLERNPTQVLILNEKGTVLANNEAWRGSADGHPIGGPSCDAGSDYFEYCERMAALYDEESAKAFRALALRVRDAVAESEETCSAQQYEFSMPGARGMNWYTLTVAPFRHASGIRVMLAFQNVTDARAEQEVERMLARLSELVQYEESCEVVYEEVARLALPSLGDAAWIDSVEPDGTLARRVFIDSAGELRRGEPGSERRPLADAPGAQQSALKVGKAVVLPELAGTALRWIADGAEAVRLMKLGARTGLVVPLVVRRQAIGVLTVIATRPDFGYGELEVRLAEAYAARAAVAIANACQLGEALRKAQEHQRVLAEVSHDLRNPLSTIQLAAELLLDTPLDPASAREHLCRIDRLAQYTSRLVTDLLDNARLGNGRLPVRPRPEDVGSLVQELVQNLGYMAESRQISLRAALFGEVPPVLIDRDRILQVLTNLIQNAFKFTPAGGAVQIEAQRDGDDVRFAVKDTGRGIAAEDLARVFEPFWQHEHTGRDGAGLGLSIVKGIIEAHGGRVWVESAKEAGAAFFFTVPAVDVPAAQLPGAA